MGTSDGFEVRRAVIGDQPRLRALRIQALTDSPAAFGSTLERELARTEEDWQRWIDAPGVTFLLEIRGQAQGLVVGVRDKDDASVVQLMAMWVHPDLRGKRAGDTLVSAIKAWAGEVRAREVRLHVVEHNISARRCYERAGFRLTGRKGVLEKNGNIEIEMRWEVPDQGVSTLTVRDG